MMRSFAIKWLLISLFVLSPIAVCAVMSLTKVENGGKIVVKVFEAPKGSHFTILRLSTDGRSVWAMFISVSRSPALSKVIFSIIQPAIALDAFSHAIVNRANIDESNPWSSLIGLAYGISSDIFPLVRQFRDCVIDKDGKVIYGVVSSDLMDRPPSDDTAIKAIELPSRKLLWERAIPQIGALELSPDGCQLWVASDQQIPIEVVETLPHGLSKYCYDEARAVYVMDVRDGAILKRIGYVGGLGVDRIVFSPDMKRAICVARGGPEGLLVIDVESLEIEEGWCQLRFSMFSSGMDASWDKDGKFFYILDRGFDSPSSVRVYNVLRKSCIGTITLPMKSPARTMVLSYPADKLFIGADDGIYVVDIAKWRKQNIFD